MNRVTIPGKSDQIYEDTHRRLSSTNCWKASASMARYACSAVGSCTCCTVTCFLTQTTATRDPAICFKRQDGCRQHKAFSYKHRLESLNMYSKDGVHTGKAFHLHCWCTHSDTHTAGHMCLHVCLNTLCSKLSHFLIISSLCSLLCTACVHVHCCCGCARACI
jgi:hypothetical protein